MIADTARMSRQDAAPVEDAGHSGAVRFAVVGWAALGVTVVLSVVSMAVPALIYHPLTRGHGEIRLYLDVLEEGNLPTWWSTALLTTAALAYGVVGGLVRISRTSGAWAWFVGGATLALLALDEHTQLHERLDRIGRLLVTYQDFPFYWLLPGLAAGAVVAGALLQLAARLRGLPRWLLLAGCALLLGSALGGELLQGMLLADQETGPRYVLTYHAEELGESIGVLLMLAAAVCSLSVTRKQDRIVLGYSRR